MSGKARTAVLLLKVNRQLLDRLLTLDEKGDRGQAVVSDIDAEELARVRKEREYAEENLRIERSKRRTNEPWRSTRKRTNSRSRSKSRLCSKSVND
jgi:hypothetical protein